MICEALDSVFCVGGTFCELKTLKITIENFRPCKQGGLVDEYGILKKDLFLKTLFGLVEKGHVVKNKINNKLHFSLDKESFY